MNYSSLIQVPCIYSSILLSWVGWLACLPACPLGSSPVFKRVRRLEVYAISASLYNFGDWWLAKLPDIALLDSGQTAGNSATC